MTNNPTPEQIRNLEAHMAKVMGWFNIELRHEWCGKYTGCRLRENPDKFESKYRDVNCPIPEPISDSNAWDEWVDFVTDKGMSVREEYYPNGLDKVVAFNLNDKIMSGEAVTFFDYYSEGSVDREYARYFAVKEAIEAIEKMVRSR